MKRGQGWALQISGGRTQLSEESTRGSRHDRHTLWSLPRLSKTSQTWWESSTLGPEVANWGRTSDLCHFYIFHSYSYAQHLGFFPCLLQLNHTGGLGGIEIVSVNYWLSRKPFGNNYLPPQNHSSTRVLMDSDKLWSPPCCRSHRVAIPSLICNDWFIQCRSLSPLIWVTALDPLLVSCLLVFPPPIKPVGELFTAKQKSNLEFQWLFIAPGKGPVLAPALCTPVRLSDPRNQVFSSTRVFACYRAIPFAW